MASATGDGHGAGAPAPRLFDGPTGDVNMAFPHKVRQLLSARDAGGAAPPAAVRASPLYGAVVRFAEAGHEGHRPPPPPQQQQQRPDGDAAARKAGAPSVGAAPVVPPSLARRGVGPRDPLLQRKLRRQQQLQPPASVAPANPSSLPLVTGEAVAGEHEPQLAHPRQASHWSQRPLQEMTPAGWDVFRAQVGIAVEVVSRRPAGQQQPEQQRRPLRYTADALSPVRCWEEARLPLALGTLVARRYVLPTPIQAQCVPLLMAAAATPSGRVDVLGVAETGSGKTAAYLVPLLADVLRRTPRLLGNESLISHGPLALVMVPTRELAEQVTREALDLVHGVPATELRRLLQEEYKDAGGESAAAGHNTLDEIRVVKVVGGEAVEAQYDELARGAHVVVGTLGQLEALLQQRLLALGNTRLVVMDEADRMIEEHQRDTLVAVLERCPLPRQTVMFTATLSAACEEVALKYFSPDGFVVVRVPNRCATITQVFEMLPSDAGGAPAEATTIPGVGEDGHGTSRQTSHPPPPLERRRHPLLHPMKFARLVAYVAYAAPPVVVFANERRTCDALCEELRAEADHLAALEENFSLEALVGAAPPALQGTSHDGGQPPRRRPAPNLGNLRSTALVHSEQSQPERRRLVDLFRRGERRVLVTTDLLARGLDVPNVTLVINYDMPRVDPAAAAASAGEEAVQKYIHRIGRTGRAGASGVAVALLCLSSALIQRAQQHVLRGDDAAAQQPLGLAGVSARSRAQELDRRELTGTKNGNDVDANLLALGAADDADDNEGAEENAEEPPRTRRRTEPPQRDGAAGGAPPPSFPQDEPLLQPLWAFLVGCAEANGAGGGRGAEMIRQQRCRLVQVPPALVALMEAFTRGSPYGAITA
ncbi:putative ATP-dependent RNA helicase [Trypanosoma conorhini]|uniref:RNA helicase n=1 Tax=Trypanosoma conorhini TaxID=83891 RepID=A0A3R7PM31_9TRYP|nr:putative ATP-dependent RNA helicase [Trypanosoma conorhini]RNF27400.1 putative ATP-dependent RNA helicase [Trypanosoma conorhini]